MQPGHEERSTIQLLMDLQQNTARLIHKEFALARAEMAERAVQLAMGIGFLMAATIVLFVALLILLMGLSELVGEFLPAALALWLGYLIVGGLALAAGVFLLVRAVKNIRSAGQFLERTSDSVGRDLRMVKERVG